MRHQNEGVPIAAGPHTSNTSVNGAMVTAVLITGLAAIIISRGR